jgi:rRNA maturation endonuclease Nob1
MDEVHCPVCFTVMKDDGKNHVCPKCEHKIGRKEDRKDAPFGVKPYWMYSGRHG